MGYFVNCPHSALNAVGARYTVTIITIFLTYVSDPTGLQMPSGPLAIQPAGHHIT